MRMMKVSGAVNKQLVSAPEILQYLQLKTEKTAWIGVILHQISSCFLFYSGGVSGNCRTTVFSGNNIGKLEKF